MVGNWLKTTILMAAIDETQLNAFATGRNPERARPRRQRPAGERIARLRAMRRGGY